MKIIETTSTDFPDAVPLPNKRGRPAAKHQKSNPGGNSGSAKKQDNVPKLAGKALTELQKADRAITAANQMILWLGPDGKKRFVRARDYERIRAEHAFR